MVATFFSKYLLSCLNQNDLKKLLKGAEWKDEDGKKDAKEVATDGAFSNFRLFCIVSVAFDNLLISFSSSIVPIIHPNSLRENYSLASATGSFSALFLGDSFLASFFSSFSLSLPPSLLLGEEEAEEEAEEELEEEADVPQS